MVYMVKSLVAALLVSILILPATTTVGVARQVHGAGLGVDRHRIRRAAEVAIAVGGKLGCGQVTGQCHDDDDVEGMRHEGVLLMKGIWKKGR